DGATVEIDGAAVGAPELRKPIRLEPGEHRGVVAAAGHESVTRSLRLAEGARETVDVDFGAPPDASGGRPPAAPPAAEPEPGGTGASPLVPPLIAFGVGAVGLGVGVVTGIMAFGKAGDLKDACPENPCSPEHQSLADDSRT